MTTEQRVILSRYRTIHKASKLGDFSYMACCTNSNEIYFWDILLQPSLKIKNAHDNDNILSMELLPNLQFATASYDLNIKIWDLLGRKLLFTLKGHTYCPFGLKYIRSSKVLASAGGDNDKNLKIWDIHAGTCLKTYSEHGSFLWGIEELSQNNIITSSGDRTIKFWDLRKNKSIKTCKFAEKCNRINSIILSDDKKYLFVCHSSGLTKLNIKTNRKATEFIGNKCVGEQPLAIQKVKKVGLFGISFMNGDLGVWDSIRKEWDIEPIKLANNWIISFSCIDSDVLFVSSYEGTCQVLFLQSIIRINNLLRLEGIALVIML